MLCGRRHFTSLATDAKAMWMPQCLLFYIRTGVKAWSNVTLWGIYEVMWCVPVSCLLVGFSRLIILSPEHVHTQFIHSDGQVGFSSVVNFNLEMFFLNLGPIELNFCSFRLPKGKDCCAVRAVPRIKALTSSILCSFKRTPTSRCIPWGLEGLAARLLLIQRVLTKC